MLHPVAAPPDNAFYAVPCPCDPPVRLPAFPADKQVGKYVFRGIALFLFLRAPCDGRFAAFRPPLLLLLYRVINFLCDDSFVVVRDIILTHLAVVFLPCFRQEIRSIAFLQKRVAHIFFVGEHLADGSFIPDFSSRYRQDALLLQMPFDTRNACPLQIHPEYQPHRFCFLRHNSQFTILSLGIAHKAVMVQYDRPVFKLPDDAPPCVLAQVKTFFLRQPAEYRDNHLAIVSMRIYMLLFKKHGNPLLAEYPEGVQRVHRIPREPADGFR